MADFVSKEVILHDVRFAFTNRLYSPDQNTSDKGDVTFKHSVSVLIPKGSKAHEEAEATITEVAKEKWKEGAGNIMKKLRANNDVCLRDGDLQFDKKGNVYAGFEGNMVIKASSKTETSTGVFQPHWNRFGVKITDENAKEFALTQHHGIRSGDYGTVRLLIWAQDHPQYGQKINCILKAVALKREGELLGGSGGRSDEELLEGMGEFESAPGMME